MATKGLVGGVNTAGQAVTASGNTSNETLHSSVGATSDAVVASVGDTTSTYSARIMNTAAAPVEYVGRESDSLSIHVDNSARTISGDVKWRSMIASTPSEEDAYHAYPANKARLSFDAINKELQDVQTDIGALEYSCKQSEVNINKYVEDLAKIQQDLDLCQKACSALRTALDGEITERELNHVKLRQKDAENFDTLKRDISNLTVQTVGRLDDQDTKLQATRDSVTSEEFRAKYTEEQLESSIKKTTELLLSTRNDLSTLDQETKLLSSRLNGIENSDQLVQAAEHTVQIEDLDNRVANLDSTFHQFAVDTTRETSRLRDITYKHESEITGLTAHIKQSENEVGKLQVDHSELKLDVETISDIQQSEITKRDSEYTHLSTRITDEASIRRETDKFHEKELSRLETRISLLQNELVQVIQNLANELRLRDDEMANELKSLSFDFIDAGQAPI